MVLLACPPVNVFSAVDAAKPTQKYHHVPLYERCGALVPGWSCRGRAWSQRGVNWGNEPSIAKSASILAVSYTHLDVYKRQLLIDPLVLHVLITLLLRVALLISPRMLVVPGPDVRMSGASRQTRRHSR